MNESKIPSQKPMTGAQALIRCLENHGVEYIWGLSGGAAIPIFMKALGKDPAQSSNIILTTVTDVVGYFAFLGLAILFSGFLIR